MNRSIKTRIISLFAIAVVFIVVINIVVGIAYGRWTELAVSDDNGQAAAEACATLFAAAYPDASEFSPNDPEYDDFRAQMRVMCSDFDMDYMYLFHYDPDKHEVRHIVCVAADDEADKKAQDAYAYNTVLYRDLSDEARRALQGEEPLEPYIFNNEFGLEATWFSKVEGTDDILAAADYSVSEQQKDVLEAIVTFVVPPIIALVVLLLVELRVLNVHVIRPVRKISKSMQEFSADRAHEFEPLGIESKDEIGEIAEAYEGMAVDIATYIDDIKNMTEERVQSEVELDVARRIQLGMVPPSTRHSGSGYDVRALAKPARQVGGDFYDCLKVDDGHIAVVIGDVSGKGVAAALFMSMTKTLIAEELVRCGAPAAVLNYANERLCQLNPEGMFVTVFVAVLERATGCVRYANAGHLPPLVVGEGVHRVDADPGVLLGLFDDADIEEGELVLQEGEALLLFTDGVTEAANAEKEFLGDERFEAHLRECVPYADAQQLVDDVMGFVEAYAAGFEQHDDVTIAALMHTRNTDGVEDERGADASEVVGGQGDGDALAVDIAAFAHVRAEILAAAPDSTRGRKACLACEEAFVNIVSYSGAENIWFDVASLDDRLRMTLIDDGVAFDPTKVVSGEKEFDELDSGGMGINLVRDLASELLYRRDGDRNIFTIVV